MNNKEIWVFAELNGCNPLSVYNELITKAEEIAETKSWNTAAVVLGENADEYLDDIKETCDKIYVANHKGLARYTLEMYATAFAELVKTYNPEMVLVGATAIGAELAPTLAAKVKTGLAAHCVDIIVDNEMDRINCMVPAFGGKVVSEIYIPEARPMMASIRPGILESAPVTRVCKEIVIADMSVLDKISPREELLEVVEECAVGVRLEAADFVIAVGRGITNEQAWIDSNFIVNRLNGAVGWSRNFIDNGFVDSENNMIGTSGKSVKPTVFIGAGISGAAHFICGMTKSKLVININNDENAKIFNHSDYGVVGDAGKFMSALAEKFR